MALDDSENWTGQLVKFSVILCTHSIRLGYLAAAVGFNVPRVSE